MGQFPNDYDEASASELSGNEKILVDDTGTKYVTLSELKKHQNLVDIITYSGDRTLLLTDGGKKLRSTAATNHTVTIPLNSSVAFQIGTVVIFRVHGAGFPTIAPALGVTVNGASFSFSQQYQEGYIQKVDTDEWDILIGGEAVDVAPPVLVSATVEDADPDEIVLTYNEPLDDTIVPATGDYTPSGGKTVTNVAIVGAVVTLTVNSAYSDSDTVTVSYDGSSSINPLQDLAGNQAADLTTEAVTNNIAGGYDADAVTVITAIETAIAGSLSTGDKDAIDARIVALKAQSKWANMKAYYGYVGGTAAAHAINWKSPGTFNMTWQGGITHSATGVLFNGTTGCGNTGINDNTVMQLDDITMGGYSRSNTNAGFMMGVADSGVSKLYIADRSVDGFIGCAHDNTDISAAMTATRTIVIARQTAAPKLAIYRDGTQLTVSAVSAVSKANANIYVGAIYDMGTVTPIGFSDKSYGSHFIYDGGFTDTEVATFSADETAFQTAMGRNV